MSERRLYEGKPWCATFEPVNNSKDAYHCIYVMADTLQDALMALGEHLPKTDCKLTQIIQNGWVRGVIV